MKRQQKKVDLHLLQQCVISGFHKQLYLRVVKVSSKFDYLNVRAKKVQTSHSKVLVALIEFTTFLYHICEHESGVVVDEDDEVFAT